MENILLNTLTFALAMTIFTVSAQQTDPVKVANAANEEKADDEIVDEDIAEFLVKSADARMMGSREGKLAVQKATTAALRNYGKLMVKDQAMLLKEIQKLAAKLMITLPSDISDKKEDGREELASKEGNDFDEKFTKMMIIDHERDIKLFEKAIECKDREVRTFAQTHLPTIQMHLDKINAIKAASK